MMSEHTMKRLERSIKGMSEEELKHHLANAEFFLQFNMMLPEWKLAYKLLSGELEIRNRR